MKCWEFTKCGFESGGKNVGAKGVCPAYPDNGTRCARITGTLCNGKIQGAFAVKLCTCMRCDFYNSKFYRR